VRRGRLASSGGQGRVGGGAGDWRPDSTGLVAARRWGQVVVPAAGGATKVAGAGGQPGGGRLGGVGRRPV
jgi:hypothetical protein